MDTEELQNEIDDLKKSLNEMSNKMSKIDEHEYRINTHKHNKIDLTQQIDPIPEPFVVLTDGATVPINSSLGTNFYLNAAGNRTILVPSNPVNGRKMIIRHYASGGARTLTLTTSAGGFRFGTSPASLSATSSGKSDYIGCKWNEIDGYWDVVAYAQGY